MLMKKGISRWVFSIIFSMRLDFEQKITIHKHIEEGVSEKSDADEKRVIYK